MQVRCPHCAHVFTTHAPGVQSCPACSTPIDVPASEGSASPGDFHERGSVREPTPWEDRERLGPVQGLWQTWQRSVLKPQEFWPTVRPDGTLSSALTWGWLMNAVGMVLAIPMMLLQLPSIRMQMEEARTQFGGNADALAVFDAIGPGSLVGMILVGVLIVWPLVSLIYVAVVHLSASLLGAGGGGFTATARAYFYAQGPNVLSAIPLGGTLVSIYSLVLFGWGLREVHGTTPGKAALAILLPLLVVCCCGCLGIFGVGATMAAAMGAGAQ